MPVVGAHHHTCVLPFLSILSPMSSRVDGWRKLILKSRRKTHLECGHIAMALIMKKNRVSREKARCHGRCSVRLACGSAPLFSLRQMEIVWEIASKPICDGCWWTACIVRWMSACAQLYTMFEKNGLLRNRRRKNYIYDIFLFSCVPNVLIKK